PLLPSSHDDRQYASDVRGADRRAHCDRLPRLFCRAMRYIVLLTGLLLHIASLTGLAQEAIDIAADAYHQARYENGDKFFKAGPYAHALFFNDRRTEALNILKE